MMAFFLACLAVFYMLDNGILAIVSINLFIMAFQFSQGPIVCMYTAEVAVDSAMGVCMFFLFLSSLEMSLTLDFIIHSSLGPEGLFIILSSVTFLGALFMHFFVKETNGLTDI